VLGRSVAFRIPAGGGLAARGRLCRIVPAAQTNWEGQSLVDQTLAGEWGERAFQVRNPNGVIVQLLDWKGTTSG